MKKIILLALSLTILVSCMGTKQINNPMDYTYVNNETSISKSLFDDKNATISEENIQKILEGTFNLPNDLRVAIVKLDNTNNHNRYNYWDEEYLKYLQKFLDLFTEKLKSSKRVKSMSNIPDILVSKNPTFTNIRESAVRTQSDIVFVYTINNDFYAKYKLFSKADLKAFATTQLIILDVKTGLIPRSAKSPDFEEHKKRKII